MNNWITVENVPYDTAVTRFKWSSESGLVVKFDEWKDVNVSTVCYSGVPKSLFEELKKEVTSDEKCVNKNYWFLADLESKRSAKLLKKRIRAETDYTNISTRAVR